MFRSRLWTALLVTLCPALAAAQDTAPGGVKKVAQEADGPKYIRVVRDEKGKPLTMDTPIVRMVKADNPNVVVDLVGAVHIGEGSYYSELNKRFEGYEAVLYELVAPPGTKIPKEGKRGNDANPVSGLQQGMKSMLGLEFQLEKIDYTKANFIHADMSPEEMAKTMKDRGESILQMFLKAMGSGMAKQGAQKNSDLDVLSALFSPDRPNKLKLAMAEQFDNMEGEMAIFDGPEGSTIITERNRKALEVLKRELDAGKKKLAIFYGAGHLADMEKRMEKDFGMKRAGEEWVVAWKLGDK